MTWFMNRARFNAPDRRVLGVRLRVPAAGVCSAYFPGLQYDRSVIPSVLPMLVANIGTAALRAAIADPERYACEPKVDGVRRDWLRGDDFERGLRRLASGCRSSGPGPSSTADRPPLSRGDRGPPRASCARSNAGRFHDGRPWGRPSFARGTWPQRCQPRGIGGMRRNRSAGSSEQGSRFRGEGGERPLITAPLELVAFCLEAVKSDPSNSRWRELLGSCRAGFAP
jgi:hypothetical protein